MLNFRAVAAGTVCTHPFFDENASSPFETPPLAVSQGKEDVDLTELKRLTLRRPRRSPRRMGAAACTAHEFFGLERQPIRWNPLTDRDIAPWPGAPRMAMWGIGKEAQRRHCRPFGMGRNGAKAPGPRWGESAPRVRRDPRPMGTHRASMRACPENRFAAIKLIPSYRIAL